MQPHAVETDDKEKDEDEDEDEEESDDSASHPAQGSTLLGWQAELPLMAQRGPLREARTKTQPTHSLCASQYAAHAADPLSSVLFFGRLKSSRDISPAGKLVLLSAPVHP